MTREQFDRWLDFATRMARACYGHRRIPDGRWIERRVRKFILAQEECLDDLHSWDENTVASRAAVRARGGVSYAVGDLFAQSWDDDEPEWYWHARRRIARETDAMSERLCRERGHSVRSKEGHAIAAALCDEADTVIASRAFDRWCEARHERWRQIFVVPVCCCVRAGLDMASATSAGVTGFTVGDLRRMYPEGIPDWAALFEGEDGSVVDIRTRPDHEGVWL